MKLELYSADLSSQLNLAFADQGIRAGFPSPAQDYMGESIDLNHELVPPRNNILRKGCRRLYDRMRN